MKATVETITPAIAVAMLEGNTMNRPHSKGTVERYASDMARGRWALNGEPIILATDGTLLDGQHRLMAIVECGEAVRALVARGVSKSAFDTIDAGRARTAGDILSILGTARANSVAAAAKAAMNFTLGRGLTEAPTRTEITRFAQAHPYLIEAAELAQESRGRLNASPLAAVIFLANEHRRFDADIAAFVSHLQTGEGLSKGDPALALREWAVNERLRNRGHLRATLAFAACARAWTAFARGERLQLIKIVNAPNRDSTTIVGFDAKHAVAAAFPDTVGSKAA